MLKYLYALSGLFLIFACNQSSQPATDDTTTDTVVAEPVEPSIELVWETDTTLLTNESVLYFPEENILFVSSIQGTPTDQDEDGYISKVTTDGTIQELKWSTGMDAPKGMAIHEGTLYVTNIDELLEINMENGEVKKRYPVEGAIFLNDVTIRDEEVYFSDMETGKLHKLSGGEVSTVKEGLDGINGVAFNPGDNHIYMLTGSGMHRMDASENITMVNDVVTGGDGLIIIDNNTFLASRWVGELWLIKDGVGTKLLDSKKHNIQTADIGYIPEENLILVPRFFSNKVSAYKLTY